MLAPSQGPFVDIVAVGVGADVEGEASPPLSGKLINLDSECFSGGMMVVKVSFRQA